MFKQTSSIKSRRKYSAGLLLLLSMLCIPNAFSFCGFYVAKADAQLFNETSQVILVRDGNHTTITMSNDFKGDVKDFAMVVPVPVVLKETDIKVVNQNIFSKFDAYSAPRMAEYYDPAPCPREYDAIEIVEEEMVFANAPTEMASAPDMRPIRDYGVTVEATYQIDEYDILILSAKESSGLKDWLTDNDYKIPAGAEEVLDPYIKSDLKFFVVKVNLAKQKNNGFNTLRPIQISFESEKFMLPIRLGMANAKGNQDMIVYAFTKGGRIESTNYRTIKIPTDNEVPEFVASSFGEFYKDVFDRAYRHRRKSVFLEYAWDLSANNMVKCDPCVTPPPILADMKQAGVDWLTIPNNTFSSQYQGKVFFTRLHVRYNRKDFPQDLMFQETPNTERFQGRYVIRHPAQGPFDCDQGQEYLKTLVDRRQAELEELADLTGWSIMKYKHYVANYANMIHGEPNPAVTPEKRNGDDNTAAADSSENRTAAVNDPSVEPMSGSGEDPANDTLAQTDAIITEQNNSNSAQAAPANTAKQEPVYEDSNWWSNPWIVGSLVVLALAALLKVLGFPRKLTNKE